MGLNFQHCSSLRTISENKQIYLKNKILQNCETCKTKVGKIALCDKCHLKSLILDKYIDANLPIDFVNRTMNEFKGDKKLAELYNNIIDNFDEKVLGEGCAYLLKGMHGVGKTYFASMLIKHGCIKYNCLYTVLTEIVSILTSGDRQNKLLAFNELKKLDLLVIDEFDPRFFGTDAAAELYGRILESVLRIRLQNKMATILISNNPDPAKSLGGDLSESISSLISGYMKEIIVIGPDFRKQK